MIKYKKLIYIALIVLLITLACAYFLFIFFDVEQLYLHEQGVIAYERHPSVLWALPIFLLFFTLVIALIPGI